MHEEKSPASGIVRITHIVEDGLLIGILAIIIVISVSQIFLRNFFDSGLSWAPPLLGILVLWVGLAGSIVASRKNHHISINILSRYLTKKGKSVAEILIALFTSCICGVIAYHSARFVISEYEYNSMAFDNVPAWVCEIILPVAFTVIALRYLAHAVSEILQLTHRKTEK